MQASWGEMAPVEQLLMRPFEAGELFVRQIVFREGAAPLVRGFPRPDSELLASVQGISMEPGTTEPFFALTRETERGAAVVRLANVQPLAGTAELTSTAELRLQQRGTVRAVVDPRTPQGRALQLEPGSATSFTVELEATGNIVINDGRVPGVSGRQFPRPEASRFGTRIEYLVPVDEDKRQQYSMQAVQIRRG